MLRLEHHWTQAQVAKELGVDPVTVRRWELGLREPSENNLFALASIYGVDFDRFLNSMLAPIQQTRRWIGLWLNDCRYSRDLSLEQAASRIGISPGVLLSYENGQVDQDPQVLVKIAAQYGTTLSGSLLNSMFMALSHHQTQLVKSSRSTSRVIPIKGIVMAGLRREEYDVDYGEITWPDPSPIGHYPNAFALVVSGDDCASDGIYDLDLVFVYPDTTLNFGKLYVVRIDGIPYIRRLIADGDRIVLKSSEGASQEFRASTMEILGEVALHLGKPGLGG